MSMANSFRGEVDIEIDGRTYPVAMTLDALARVAGAMGVETLVDVEARLQQFRIADFLPVMAALLAGNGHEVPAETLGRLHFATFVSKLGEVYRMRPGAPEAPAAGAQPKGEAKTSPQKRAA